MPAPWSCVAWTPQAAQSGLLDRAKAADLAAGTKEAKAHTKRVEMLAKGGIDAVLAELMQPKKLTVMDKTKADWRNVKDGDSELQEDLQHHQRGGRTYRAQQDFLQQADFREYELERDARLAANSKR